MTLAVEGLEITLALPRGAATVVQGVDLALAPGRVLGIVGESGSGKSMLALGIIGLLPPGAHATGRVLLDGTNLLDLDEAALCRVRGNRIGMIFQEPMTALNPTHRIGRQIAEGLRLHKGLDAAAARAEAMRLLARVRIADAASRFDDYPHQLSGGQRQRVGIAIALACGPALLIADEPTTALDVTVQAEILDLLGELVDGTDMALILISHDLGVIGELTDEMLVLYAGSVVERGPTAAVFATPVHPYTRALFGALPGAGGRLTNIPGQVPGLLSRPSGCVFADRCAYAREGCRAARPALQYLGSDRAARCIRIGELP